MRLEVNYEYKDILGLHTVIHASMDDPSYELIDKTMKYIKNHPGDCMFLMHGKNGYRLTYEKDQLNITELLFNSRQSEAKTNVVTVRKAKRIIKEFIESIE